MRTDQSTKFWLEKVQRGVAINAFMSVLRSATHGALAASWQTAKALKLLTRNSDVWIAIQALSRNSVVGTCNPARLLIPSEQVQRCQSDGTDGIAMLPSYL